MRTTLQLFGRVILAALATAGTTTWAPAAETRASLRSNSAPEAFSREVGAASTTQDRRSAVRYRTSSVSITEETMVLPTYEVGAPEVNPMFYTQESYQGAQKRIYPYAFQDNLTHARTNVSYKALKLENEYIRLVILPEIGGRLFEAVDKSNGYDFFYRQHVIKPALIGMLGAWISGGIEWCAFHHHRNTTFMPLDYTLVENVDGSKTIWFGETERRHRMRWLIGVTLYPEKSYFETTVKFFNRTPLPNSILYWANVAVHVNEDYQILFPPSVQVATYHSKIDFTQWPVSQVKYRGMDYRGVDLSWWKNHPEPNSFFAWDLPEDFMGGYDHGREAGVVHVGNHHEVCGAKLWEWGTGPFGRRWDKILTDEDGPYAELMVGAFSDNQPDYSWIKPGEVKTFKQYWYPVREIGGFKHAGLNGAVNLELRTNRAAIFGFHTTERHRKAKALLEAGDQVISETTIDISPAKAFRKEITVPEGTRETDLRAVLLSAEGQELLSYHPVERTPVTELPKPVKPPPPPKEIKTADELYLTGLRVEQIHNPSVDPTKYYQEALSRDPGDTRANTAMGIHYLKRGLYGDAERHLHAALERYTAEYTRPANAEAHFYLGLAYREQGKMDRAYDQFYRASWDRAWRSPAFYQLAELSCRKGDFTTALDQINESLSTETQNTRARDLKAAILRKRGILQEAVAVANAALRIDPLDFLAMNELALTQAARGYEAEAKVELTRLRHKMRDEVQSYLELATDYLRCGLVDEAIGVLQRPVQNRMPFASTYPLVYYYLGYLHALKGDQGKAGNYFTQARTMPSQYCFPFRLESVEVLNAALHYNNTDARAWYYLGNLLYELQPEKALACWEKARDLDAAFPTAHRNLGWGYFRVKNDLTNAIASYQKAIACSGDDPRLLFELDNLYEFANTGPERRLALFEQHHETARKRVESFTREIAVLVLGGQYDAAIGHLDTNYFHVREGSSEIHDYFVDAHLLKGFQLLKSGETATALKHFRKASEYPENLSVGRPKQDRRAPQVAYCTAIAYEASGQPEKAGEFFQEAANQADTENWPDARFFQALSWRKLGDETKAGAILEALQTKGKELLKQGETSDFFAKFGEQETRQTRKAAAHFQLGLACLGKGERDQARQEFEQAVQLNRSHPWAKYYLEETR